MKINLFKKTVVLGLTFFFSGNVALAINLSDLMGGGGEDRSDPYSTSAMSGSFCDMIEGMPSSVDGQDKEDVYNQVQKKRSAQVKRKDQARKLQDEKKTELYRSLDEMVETEEQKQAVSFFREELEKATMEYRDKHDEIIEEFQKRAGEVKNQPRDDSQKTKDEQMDDIVNNTKEACKMDGVDEILLMQEFTSQIQSAGGHMNTTGEGKTKIEIKEAGGGVISPGMQIVLSEQRREMKDVRSAFNLRILAAKEQVLAVF